MPIIKPFKALKPQNIYAKNIATKPYDVVNALEIREEAKTNPLTFFKVTRSELDFDINENPYSEKIYNQAKNNLQELIKKNILIQDKTECFYIYSLTMENRTQVGLVCLSSVEDYNSNIIKKHELTRPDKENDRINHIITTQAQTGNVFLAYNNNINLDNIINTHIKNSTPIFNIITDDNITHKIWEISSNEIIEKIINIFKSEINYTYIADGHHRAASAAKTHERLKTEKSKYFLTTLFPSNQLKIMDYNRVVKDLNNYSIQEFLDLISSKFLIEKKSEPAIPNKKEEFGMYINNQWYLLTAKQEIYSNLNTIDKLNVSILQNNILNPILNIDDPRTNKRIDFVGGIRGWQELVNLVDKKYFAIAFLIFPISMEELFEIADNNQIMPPKSTWFEPKLRDGLLTNLIS